MTWMKKFKKGNIKSYAAGENVRVQLYFDWAEKTYYSEEKLVIGSAGRIEVDELPKGLSNQVKFINAWRYDPLSQPCVTVFDEPMCKGRSDAFCATNEEWNEFDAILV